MGNCCSVWDSGCWSLCCCCGGEDEDQQQQQQQQQQPQQQSQQHARPNPPAQRPGGANTMTTTRPVIGRPTDISIHIPRNRTDAQGVPIPLTSHDIDRGTLEHALTLVGDFLHQRSSRLQVIAVGGAVNTILLRTRDTTHDVDVFGTNLDMQARTLLDEAMQYAIQQSPQQLGTDWFNTENQMWMSPTVHAELTREALAQNDIVFDHGGLQLLAAPWEYAFSGKLARLLTGGSQIRPYDLQDAVTYLHRIVQGRADHTAVPVSEVEAWARRFNHQTSRNYLLNTVNAEYRKLHHADGIVA